jgi:glycosyltransferase involved in cell wall biosynthesis
MPTYNRPQFVPLAIKQFLNQDYPIKELIIIDDGSLKYKYKKHKSIRVVSLDRKKTIGWKRNLGISMSNSDVIMMWDDDDIYSKHRISYQLNPINKGVADATVFKDCIYHVLQSKQNFLASAKLHKQLWFAGYISGTLAILKSKCAGIHYPNVSLGEDQLFLNLLFAKKKINLKKLPHKNHFSYVRHNFNSFKFPINTYDGNWKQLS